MNKFMNLHTRPNQKINKTTKQKKKNNDKAPTSKPQKCALSQGRLQL